MEFEFIKISETEECSELELYFSLNETQLRHYYEPEPGLFVVESPMVIERALMSGYEPQSFVMLDTVAKDMCKKFADIIEDNYKSLDGDYKLSDENNKSTDENDIGLHNSLNHCVPVYVGDYDTIAGMTGVNITRGVLALMKRIELSPLEKIVKNCHRIAVFDGVENPTNVGAMFRSAAALGVEAVILTDSSSDPLYRRASRVSVGTVFQIPWTKLNRKKNKFLLNDSLSYIDALHQLGFKTAAMALTDNSIGIEDLRLKQEERLAIILGNEGFGLSDDVIESSDYVVKIPMTNGVDSLNVAAASAVIFWELTKKEVRLTDN